MSPPLTPALISQYYDLAADVLAENDHLGAKFLSQYLYDYIDAKIMTQSSPEEVIIGGGTL